MPPKKRLQVASRSVLTSNAQLTLALCRLALIVLHRERHHAAPGACQVHALHGVLHVAGEVTVKVAPRDGREHAVKAAAASLHKGNGGPDETQRQGRCCGSGLVHGGP